MGAPRRGFPSTLQDSLITELDLVGALQALPRKRSYEDMLQCMFGATSPTYARYLEEQGASALTENLNLATAGTLFPYDINLFGGMAEDMSVDLNLGLDSTWLHNYDLGSDGTLQLDDALAYMDATPQ